MEFRCTNCDDYVGPVTVDGYVIAHMTENLSPPDLERVTFEIESSEGDVDKEDVSSEDENYLEKFSSPYEEIAEAMNGRVDAVDLGIKCPDCGGMETIEME